MNELINSLLKEVNAKDWSQLKKKISNFPNFECSTSNADCYFLALLVKKFKPVNILEIGTFVGKSTFSLACAAASNKTKFNIDTIDIKKKVIKNKFRRFRQIKFYNDHSSKILPKLKKKYDLMFIDANLDDLTAAEIKKKCKKTTLIVLHDFCPPVDKGVYDLFCLSKFINFIYYTPNIYFNKNLIKYINPITTELNFFKNLIIEKNKINLCCCLISFRKFNKKLILPNLSGAIKGNNFIFSTLLINFIFFDKLLSFKKRIYIFNFYNTQFSIDLHERKINVCGIKNGYIYLKKIYLLNDSTLEKILRFKNLVVRLKNFFLRFKT
jgi:predicted O-methyltransferase YrrM